MKARRRRLGRLFGIGALVAVVAGFAVAGPATRALLLAFARHATGLQLDAQRIERRGGAFVVTGLHLATPGDGVVVEAPRARVTTGGGTVGVVLDRPDITVHADRIVGNERLRWNGAKIMLRIRDGTLAVTGGSPSTDPIVKFDGLAGNAALRSGSVLAYDLSLQLVARGQRYPLSGHAGVADDGTIAHAWTASALPLSAFAATFGPDARLQPHDGWLRDVAVQYGTKLHATTRLDGVDAAFGAHTLHGLHGTLVADGDGLGSRKLSGTLDAALPFTGAGEVHDADAQGRWLRAGTPDLDALGNLLTSIAGEPRLASVQLEATAPGLAFAQYAMAGDHGPLSISVLSLDPHQTTLRLDTAIAEDHIFSGGERTSALGVRTGAVGGVNGDYFDIGRTYQPQGMLMRSGELVRGPTDRGALVIDKTNHVTIAEFHLRGTVRTPEGVMPLTEFNDWPPGDVAVITPAFGKQLPAAPGHTFVALSPLGGKRYRVTDVVNLEAPIPAQFGIAIGPLVHVPLPHRGETLALDYDLDPHVENAVAGIGGGPILLRDGQPFEDPHAPAPDERNYRWPVIALARQSDDRLVFVAVDGRHPERSVGMTRPEFTQLLQRFGGVDAMALDSGGSVTLVSRAPGDLNPSVRNVPSDNSAERWISDALFIYSSAPVPTIVPPANAPTPVPESRPAP